MVFLLISFWWDLLISVLVLSYVLYKWLERKFSFWERLGVPGPYPKLNSVLLTKSKLYPMCLRDIYMEYKDKPYVGIYQVTAPTLLIRDLEFIKRIMIKDFNHFTDRNGEVNIEANPLGQHLFNLRGELWKNLRAKLTPTFTTSRIKQMFGLVEDCSRGMIEYMDTYNEDTIEMKEILTRLNIDVIGRCAYGIECNSFKDPNSQFRIMAKRIFESIRGIRSILLLMFRFLPKLFNKLNISLLTSEIDDFFINLVKDSVEYREKNKIERNDFLNLLIKLKNNELDGDNKDAGRSSDNGLQLTITQLASQVFVFFIAGFETSSATASFALYELALNPDIQDKLAKEIDYVLEKHGGRFTYDSLAEMTYLANVVEETLRMHPSVPMLFRICTKDYTIPETNIKIPKGTQLVIPNYAIQRDSELYSNPNKFDPDRFTPENKAKRHHFSNLPFGEGPRSCIGNRFALMQSQLSLASMIRNYEFSVCEKTLIPMEYDKDILLLTSKEGIWLKFKKRVR